MLRNDDANCNDVKEGRRLCALSPSRMRTCGMLIGTLRARLEDFLTIDNHVDVTDRSPVAAGAQFCNDRVIERSGFDCTRDPTSVDGGWR